MRMKKQTIVITGAAGNIGSKLRPHLTGRYELRLLDKVCFDDTAITEIDLSRWDERIVDIFRNVDAVVHLAADPYDAKGWDELIQSNLDVLNNVFIAAIKAKVPRVVFASSNHVMGGYQTRKGIGRWLDTRLDPMPGTHYTSEANVSCDSTPYAAMKLFGERLGKSYAEANDAVCIALRLGWVNRAGHNTPEDLPAEAPVWFKKMWLSTPDMCQLIERAITVPKEPGCFLVVNGMSNNAGMVWNIEDGKTSLGYEPVDGLKSKKTP
jgi:NAD+ dependent glucose-6-phosphate dehydrogenase